MVTNLSFKIKNNCREFEIHFALFSKGFSLFCFNVFDQIPKLEFEKDKNLLNFSIETNLSPKEIELIKFIISNFLEISSKKEVSLKTILFMNIFYNISDSLIVNIFKLTNIFDRTTLVWRNGWIEKEISKIKNEELKKIIFLLSNKKDREILRNLIYHFNTIFNYLISVYKDYPLIYKKLKEIGASNLKELIKRKTINGVELDEIDIIKDIRNIAVHGFSTKDIKISNFIESSLPQILKDIIEKEYLKELYILLALIELEILRHLS